LQFNKLFFPIVNMCLRFYRLTKLCDGAQMANFWPYFASSIFSKPRAAHFRPAF